MTKSEKRLWHDSLKDHQLGHHFRCQHPIGPYVLDFYCSEAKLCIEADGESNEGREQRDARRDAWLAHHGILTLRIPSDSVMLALGEVLFQIQFLCDERSKR